MGAGGGLGVLGIYGYRVQSFCPHEDWTTCAIATTTTAAAATTTTNTNKASDSSCVAVLSASVAP